MQQVIDLYVAPTTVTQTITTTRTAHQGYNPTRGTPQNQGYTAGSTPQEQGYHLSTNAAPQHRDHNSHNSEDFQSAPWDNTIPQHQESTSRNSLNPQNREHVPRNSASIRPIKEGDFEIERASMSRPSRGIVSLNSRSEDHSSLNLQNEDDAGLARRSSIARKQVGTSTGTHYSSVPVSSPPRAQTDQSRQQSVTKPLPSTPVTLGNQRQTDSSLQPSSIPSKSRSIPSSQTSLSDAQNVVDRAKTDSYDTDVVETVAPGQSHF